jgi:hypothetical protein
MPRKPRNRDAERAALTAAANRLLAGQPLRSGSGKLTVTELIVESQLRRDVVYADHQAVVEEFRVRVKAQNSTPAAMQKMADSYDTATRDLAAAKDELAKERATTAALRRVIAELTLELEQAHEELREATKVTRLPHRHG